MRCPFCNARDTKVIDSRAAGEGDQVRRRRECIECRERFTTYAIRAEEQTVTESARIEATRLAAVAEQALFGGDGQEQGLGADKAQSNRQGERYARQTVSS